MTTGMTDDLLNYQSDLWFLTFDRKHPEMGKLWHEDTSFLLLISDIWQEITWWHMMAAPCVAQSWMERPRWDEMRCEICWDSDVVFSDMFPWLSNLHSWQIAECLTVSYWFNAINARMSFWGIDIYCVGLSRKGCIPQKIPCCDVENADLTHRIWGRCWTHALTCAKALGSSISSALPVAQGDILALGDFAQLRLAKAPWPIFLAGSDWAWKNFEDFEARHRV